MAEDEDVYDNDDFNESITVYTKDAKDREDFELSLWPLEREFPFELTEANVGNG